MKNNSTKSEYILVQAKESISGTQLNAKVKARLSSDGQKRLVNNFVEPMLSLFYSVVCEMKLPAPENKSA